MSSACVCHLNEWCFYCEMYSPVEKERDKYKAISERAETLLEDIMHGTNLTEEISKEIKALRKMIPSMYNTRL